MSLSRIRRRSGTPPLTLIEEAVALLRHGPGTALAAYYIGAIPFWLGLLYFVSDMSQSAYAAQRVADGAFGMAALFIWNKCWHAAACSQWRAHLAGRPGEPWTLRRILRMATTQTIHQPWGLLLRPLAAIATLPFVWVSAYYQNLIVLGDGSENTKSPAAQAAAMAKLWPLQAHGAVAIVYLFTLFVWANFFILILFVPQMLKSFFAIETEMSRAGEAAMNSTVLGASMALTSLVSDPLRKALFVLRCFRGIALRSGADLTAEIRTPSRRRASPIAAAAAAILLLLGSPASTPAENAAPIERGTAPPAEVDRTIREVLNRREFAWRSPRMPQEQAQKGWLQGFLESISKRMDETLNSIGRQFGRFLRWVGGLFKPRNPLAGTSPSIDWVGLSKAILMLLGAVLVGLIIWMLYRYFQTLKARPIAAIPAAAPAPDLLSEDIVASQLPEEGWLALARDHAARGELVLALRAAWLAGLAHLGQRNLIAIARYKSNRDYERELRRRARDRAALLSAFDANLLAFERSWYGSHEVTRSQFDTFEGHLARIRES
jgi:hypothetical protein